MIWGGSRRSVTRWARRRRTEKAAIVRSIRGGLESKRCRCGLISASGHEGGLLEQLESSRVSGGVMMRGLLGRTASAGKTIGSRRGIHLSCQGRSGSRQRDYLTIIPQLGSLGQFLAWRAAIDVSAHRQLPTAQLASFNSRLRCGCAVSKSRFRSARSARKSRRKTR